MGSALSACEDAQHRQSAGFAFKPHEWDGEGTSQKVADGKSAPASASTQAAVKGKKDDEVHSMIGPASGSKASKKAPAAAPSGKTDGPAPEAACVSGLPIVAKPRSTPPGKAAGQAPAAAATPAQQPAAGAEATGKPTEPGGSPPPVEAPASATAASPAAAAAEAGYPPTAAAPAATAGGAGKAPAAVASSPAAPKSASPSAAAKGAAKAASPAAPSRGGASSSSAAAAVADPGPQVAGGADDESQFEELRFPDSPPGGLHTPLPSHEVAKERKALFKAISEENYSMRTKFGRVPRTAYVTAAQCEAAMSELRSQKKTLFSFSNWTTADALLHFGRDTRNKVVGLSFGNGHQVGGGYKTGSIAQEEDLCRRLPTLYTSLYQSKQHESTYPFGPCTCSSASEPKRYSDVLFTPGLVVARAGEDVRFELLDRHQQATVGLVTACAPDVNRRKEVFDLELVYRTVKSIFLAPVICQRDTTTLILGAWGCGAFGGDPAVISELFVKALKTDQLGNYYREVHFAIPGNQADLNARTFRDALRQAKLNVKEYS